MRRSEILNLAKEYITRDRADTYGDAEDNFSAIASHWNTHLRGKLSAPITPNDVGMMMALMKIARIGSSPKHGDSYIDACGYAAISGELACKVIDSREKL